MRWQRTLLYLPLPNELLSYTDRHFSALYHVTLTSNYAAQYFFEGLVSNSEIDVASISGDFLSSRLRFKTIHQLRSILEGRKASSRFRSRREVREEVAVKTQEYLILSVRGLCLLFALAGSIDSSVAFAVDVLWYMQIHAGSCALGERLPTCRFYRMSTGLRRIMREAAQMRNDPTLAETVVASPTEENAWEFHFTVYVRAFNGFYHGKLSLPSTYPLVRLLKRKRERTSILYIYVETPRYRLIDS